MKNKYFNKFLALLYLKIMINCSRKAEKIDFEIKNKSFKIIKIKNKILKGYSDYWNIERGKKCKK